MSARDDEIKVSGYRAAKALEKARRDDIVRVYLVEERIRDFSSLLSWCADERKPYRVIPPDEMEAVSESTHHEGVCIVTAGRPILEPREILERAGRASIERILFLDGVDNPHNIGALVRVGAHFGVSAVILGSEAPSRIPPAVYRTAEGALEHVAIGSAGGNTEILRELRSRGFVVIGTSSRAEHSLFDARLAPRVVVVLGSEASGISEETRALCDDVVKIPGSGTVSSLNVASAGAVLLAELWRRGETASEPQRRPFSSRIPTERTFERRPRRDDRDGERPSYERRPRNDDRGAERSFERRPRTDRDGERASERRPRRDDSRGERPSYERRPRSDDRGAERSFERRPRRDDRGGDRASERRPRTDRDRPRTSTGGRFERKSRDEGRDTTRTFERRPRESDSRAERPSYERRPRRDDRDGDRASERRPRRDRDATERRPERAASEETGTKRTARTGTRRVVRTKEAPRGEKKRGARPKKREE